MKIKLMIASNDSAYAEHLSRVLVDKYEDEFEVTVCTDQVQFVSLLGSERYDSVLLEPAFAACPGLEGVRLPVLLCDQYAAAPSSLPEWIQIEKYQRISSIVGSILEQYAQFGIGGTELGKNRARVTAVWSPAGGTGKTTVALAYSARKAAGGKQVTYLSLENFCSIPAFFPGADHEKRSISTVLEKLGSDLPMLLKSILQHDGSSGISYYCGPSNYDDINILTDEDIELLLGGCAAGTEELVVDLSAQCDHKTQKIFELSDTVLLVNDGTPLTQVKLQQFLEQHNTAQLIRHKSVLINNKGAQGIAGGPESSVKLPFVRTQDVNSVYKTLSGNPFQW